MTTSNMIDMFWVQCDRMSTFTSSGIEITVKGKKRVYEVMTEAGVPDIEWRRKHTYERFVVKYDPYDFGSIRLYRKDKAGELRFERVAEPYLVIHRAIQEQTEGEATFIRQQQKATEQSRIERQVAAKAIEYAEGVAPEQHGLSTPDLKGVTADVQRQIDRRTRKYSREPRFIPLAILSITMALPTFLTSCSSDDELLPDTPEVLKPTITNWIEPWHIQGSGIDEVKAYMSTSMYGYTLTNESSSTTNYQLVYSGSYEPTGVLYSFTKHEVGLYSVIDTELCVNKSVIIKYLKEHYSLVPGSGNDDQNIQYLFTTPDKSMVITTLKVSDECFNISYSFVTH